MQSGHAATIDAFEGRRVLVLGDAMLDRYLHGSSERLSREAPVPIVGVEDRVDAPGGAANTAVNARRLGAEVTFLGLLGDDPEAATLLQVLDRHGVDGDALVGERGRVTIAKHRVLADGQLLCRFDHGRPAAAGPEAEQALVERLSAAWSDVDVVLVADYGYGAVTPRVLGALRDLQHAEARVLVVDAKDPRAYRSLGATAVKPNFGEAAALLALPAPAPGRSRADLVAAHGARILELTGARIAAVTVDVEGAVVLEHGAPAYRTYTRPTTNTRAAGAGDTYVAALALALAAGAATHAAAELAAAAAEVVVAKDGTSTCSRAELLAAVAGGEKHVADRDALDRIVAEHREGGRRVVFTNGCFDLLHRGHVTFLNWAKALGDVLVVGVNSDASTRRLKGDDRPINALEDRTQVLAALSAVDHVVPFDEDTADELIRIVRPDVFVKGGDHSLEELPEAALVARLGGAVRILPTVADGSTTAVIDRIRAEAGGARSERAS